MGCQKKREGYCGRRSRDGRHYNQCQNNQNQVQNQGQNRGLNNGGQSQGQRKIMDRTKDDGSII